MGRRDGGDQLATGLIALLDDVAAIAKVAAASVDDVIGQSAKAGAKAAGVVIDDAAVTPRYVTGFTADRELPIVAKIAVGSLRNKLLVLLPVALALSLFAPWAITPLLMIGGLYLCYEGAEKVWETLSHRHAPPSANDQVETVEASADEDAKVSGAIKTDFVLSAEIMAITLAAVPDSPFWTQAIVLALVGAFITFGVYGAVALIVKADDAGVALARHARTRIVRAFGRGLVLFMPYLMTTLSAVGTAAMIWVGGGILAHGLEHFGMGAVQHMIETLARDAAAKAPVATEAVHWLVSAAAAGALGLAVGGVLIVFAHFIAAPAVRAVVGVFRRA